MPQWNREEGGREKAQAPGRTGGKHEPLHRASYGPGLIRTQGTARLHRQASAGLSEPEFIRPGALTTRPGSDACRLEAMLSAGFT